MCRKYCPHVFPNYDVRFDYPGKVGQARLFRKMGVPFPRTRTFDCLASYRQQDGTGSCRELGFPCVFKFDWGGEGEGVFLIKTADALEKCLQSIKAAEQGGRRGFLLQEHIPCAGRSLRVVVMEKALISYWRVGKGPSAFLTNLKAGAVIDHGADPEIQEEGKKLVRDFCSKTGLNLAAFDLVFSEDPRPASPRFLEINYFFGRRGLGGSFEYYRLLDQAVAEWLQERGLRL
jgi:ribosomal protein S6--L-glutamate ligase